MSRATEDVNRRMLRARDAMDRAYAEPLDISALARIAYVSEAHFIRTFKATFGETPHRYLQRRRVERAMFLAPVDRPQHHRHLPGHRFHQPRHVQPDLRPDRRRAAEPLPRPRPAAARAVVFCHDLDPAVILPAGRRAAEQFRRSAASVRLDSVEDMITTLAITSIFVLDQDQALDFYVGKLGLEVATDADLGFMRWLTVKVPGESREILLELPARPPTTRRPPRRSARW